MAGPGGEAEATILHVDMDAFYASVEQRDDPVLQGRPVVVGGPARDRGVVAAASYEARRFGVRSAMPMARATRLCPDLVVIRPRIERYLEDSRAIMAIFADHTPLVEPLSLDEAFLDLAGTAALLGPAPAVARRIKARIRQEIGLVASVGLATSKLVAKIASDQDKPDGFVVVAPGTEAAFLAPLPADRIFGVGKVAAAALARLGIRTIGDLAAADPALLTDRFGALGGELSPLARGIDPRPVVPSRAPKGHSQERTFARDVTRMSVLERHLLRFADRVAWDLRRQGYVGRVVQLKVRTHDFKTLSRSRTLDGPTALAGPLYTVGLALLRALEPLPPVRLLGLGLAGLAPAEAPRQGDLFAEEGGEKEERRLADGVDRIREKYGRDAIGPGRFLEREEGDREV